MLFEDQFQPEPLYTRIDPGDGGDIVADIQYSETGFVVVGADHTDSGQMMIVSDAEGRALGVAFADGDGNWNNELEALKSGAICVGGIAGTAATEGALSILVGAAAAAECAETLSHLGTLYNEYNNQTPTYNQSVSTYLDPSIHGGWDGNIVIGMPMVAVGL